MTSSRHRARLPWFLFFNFLCHLLHPRSLAISAVVSWLFSLWILIPWGLINNPWAASPFCRKWWTSLSLTRGKTGAVSWTTLPPWSNNCLSQESVFGQENPIPIQDICLSLFVRCFFLPLPPSPSIFETDSASLFSTPGEKWRNSRGGEKLKSSALRKFDWKLS